MAENGYASPEEIEQNKQRIAEEKKRLKEEKKAQKKEAKLRAKEIASQEEELDDEIEGGSAPVLLVTLIIVTLWITILGLLIKLDVGGFGSGVLAPVLRNVPVINKILPAEKMPTGSDTPSSDFDEEYGQYQSIQEAVDQIKRLELELELAQDYQQNDSKRVEELEAEIDRLRTFENNQIAFEKIKNQFYNEVVYADKGPGPDEYIKYYESMDPTTAQKIYQEVVQKKAVDSEIQQYAQAYSEMKAKEAAGIFEAMQDDLELAAKILGAMDATDRGKILGAMNPEVAARITKIMEPDT